MTTRGPLWRSASTVSSLLLHGARSPGFAGLFVGLRDLAAQGAGHVVRRFGWAFADQLLSSGTNFLLNVLVARTVGVRDLGAFSVAYATFTFSLGGVRAIASELLIIRHSYLAEREWRDGIRRSVGTALLVGIVIGAGCLVAATTLAGSVSSVLTIVGISLPLLLVQDVSRFALLARQRGAAALLSDAAWAAVMFTAFVLFREAGVASVKWFTFSWAGAGCVAAVVGLLQLKVLPCGPITAVRWLRGHSDIAPRLLAEFAITTGVSMVTVFAIGGIAGLGELGRLQAAQILLGPLNIMFSGVGLVATAEAVRLLRDSPRRFAHDCRWLSLALTMGVLAWGMIIAFVPRSIGEAVLRTNWDAGRSLVAPLLIAFVCYASTFGASIGLHCLAAARRILRVRCVEGVLTLFFGLAGAYLAGAKGGAWGFAVAGSLKSVNAWWQFSRALREYEAGRSEAGPGGPGADYLAQAAR
jgi:O-antigen/teichoic acid export membrane protein